MNVEREAEIREVLSRFPEGSSDEMTLGWRTEARYLLAALDAERERADRAEQQAETLAEALARLLTHCDNYKLAVMADKALAGYRAATGEAKP